MYIKCDIYIYVSIDLNCDELFLHLFGVFSDRDLLTCEHIDGRKRYSKYSIDFKVV